MWDNFFENIFVNLHSTYTVRFSVIKTLLLKFEGVLSIPDTILIYQHETGFKYRLKYFMREINMFYVLSSDNLIFSKHAWITCNLKDYD